MRYLRRRSAIDRALRGDLHLVRLEALAHRLETGGPIPATIVRSRGVSTRLTFRLADEVDLHWWSYWSRPVEVTRLLQLGWVDEVGWRAMFSPVDSIDPTSPGLVRDPETGMVVLRHFAYRAEVVPLTARTTLLAGR